jgi:hypothetical protein
MTSAATIHKRKSTKITPKIAAMTTPYQSRTARIKDSITTPYTK